MTFQSGIRNTRASSIKSAFTVRVPCQTLVIIKGIAVMNTTKIVVALEMPNQMMAKIAQIAEETVLSTGITGSLVRAKHDAERQSHQGRKHKTYSDTPERDAEIAPQVTIADNELQCFPHPRRPRQDVMRHRQC